MGLGIGIRQSQHTPFLVVRLGGGGASANIQCGSITFTVIRIAFFFMKTSIQKTTIYKRTGVENITKDTVYYEKKSYASNRTPTYKQKYPKSTIRKRSEIRNPFHSRFNKSIKQKTNLVHC